MSFPLAPFPAAACAPAHLHYEIGDSTVACYTHCRNARQSTTTGAPHAATPLHPQTFDQCMAQCRNCEYTRRYWGQHLDYGCIQEGLLHDLEYQRLKRRVEDDDDACPRCRHRLRRLLRAHQVHCAAAPPPPWSLPAWGKKSNTNTYYT